MRPSVGRSLVVDLFQRLTRVMHPLQDCTVMVMQSMFRRSNRFISWWLVAEVLERWEFYVVHDQPSRISTGSGGLANWLSLVGFTHVFLVCYFLPFAISQHLASWDVLDWFPYVLIRFLSVPKNPVQVFNLLHVLMSSGLVDLMIDNLVDDKICRLIIFLVLSISRLFVTTTVPWQALSTSVSVISDSFFLLLGSVIVVTFFVNPFVTGNGICHVCIFVWFFAPNYTGWSILRNSVSVCVLRARAAHNRNPFFDRPVRLFDDKSVIIHLADFVRTFYYDNRSDSFVRP